MAGFVVKSMATVQAEVEKETGRAFTRRTIFDLRQFRLGRYELPTVNLQEIHPCV